MLAAPSFGACSLNFSTLVGQEAMATNGATSAAVWPQASAAVYIPFQVIIPWKVNSFAFRVNTQSGNCDVGIFDEGGTCLVAKGATVVGAAGLQVVDLSASVSRGTAGVQLGVGTYYMAMSVDNITASVFRIANVQVPVLRACGLRQQTSAYPLPATATFATLGNNYCPNVICGPNPIV